MPIVAVITLTAPLRMQLSHPDATRPSPRGGRVAVAGALVVTAAVVVCVPELVAAPGEGDARGGEHGGGGGGCDCGA